MTDKKGQFSERWKFKTQNIEKGLIDKKIFQIKSYRDNLELMKKINDLFNISKEGIEFNMSEDDFKNKCNNLLFYQAQCKELKSKTHYFETQVYPYLFPVFQEVVWKGLMEANLESPYLTKYQRDKANSFYDDIPEI